MIINFEFYKKLTEDLCDHCKKLVVKLQETTFYKEPAAVSHHHDYIGGLAIHCYEIFLELKKLVVENNINVDHSTLFLIAVGHDLDKLRRYIYNHEQHNFSYRPIKMDGMFHGERSFSLLNRYLGEEFKSHPNYDLLEKCITGHMGDNGWRVAKEYYAKHNQFYPLMFLTHKADEESCRLNGEGYEKLTVY